MVGAVVFHRNLKVRQQKEEKKINTGRASIEPSKGVEMFQRLLNNGPWPEMCFSILKKVHM
ncbi:hypothetical protein DVA81_18620 [Acinetobacter baumannii]|nr:hypothetical protein DVA81_18620 [Acinetobacter baumannii]